MDIASAMFMNRKTQKFYNSICLYRGGDYWIASANAQTENIKRNFKTHRGGDFEITAANYRLKMIFTKNQV